MQKQIVTFFYLLITSLVLAQNGVIHTESMKSDILKRDMGYSVYLPPSYHHSVRSYPVLYLMHGMTGDHMDWVIKGETAHIATQAMVSGRVPEMIISDA
jgi:enterochelin esterase-like enzyme